MEFAGKALGVLTDAQWVEGQIKALPPLWQDFMRSDWTYRHADDRRGANLAILRAVRELGDAQRAGLPLDANDDQIRARAVVFARHYAAGLSRVSEAQGEAWALEQMERHGMADYWPDADHTAAALARLKDERFWRRVLRKVFAQTVEKCSIGLGLVNKGRDCYVSTTSVKRRRVQLATSAAMMENTELENELGQRMKLSDLAAKSMANKTVRRAELMTRISGFDVIAQDLQHDATFVTVTCPSRMHKWTDKGGGVFLNPRYDETTPREAQQYLSGQWAKMRSAMKRRGLEVYGFRVTEPHHDGCPHWHMLMFHQAGHGPEMRGLFTRYFLQNDSANERGADKYRVKFERIDRTKGSAASYIAKYISKNVDGYKVGVDLHGNPAIESSVRVEAWASTWRIRQFQQVGGPPVTVWRELRRLNPDNLEAGMLPDQLTAALRGVNIGQMGGRLAHGWQAYTMAQGGPCVSRKHQKIKLLRMDTGEHNRYGEVKAADVVGVEAMGTNLYLPKHCAHLVGADKGHHRITRPAAARIESERLQWRTVIGGVGFLPGSEAARPWTRVNNCTREEVPVNGGVRAYAIVTRGKLGRVKKWTNSGGAGGHQQGVNVES
jgi:Bacteriophage replication gene A protein (GPA)